MSQSNCITPVDSANDHLVNAIKLLLYKNDSEIFEKMDFDNDEIYTSPLLFAYFNNKSNNHTTLDSILIGYYNEIKKADIISDEFGRIYVSKIGWIQTTSRNQVFSFDKEKMILKKDNKQIEFDIEDFEFIKNTNIEILKYSIPLFKQCYYNTNNQLIEIEIEKITKKHIPTITKAYSLIKEYIPEQYNLIEKYCPKCVIFNVDTYQRNSFAHMAAQGVSFHNAYQEEYDEVFFIDDIAHQSGHVIFNAMIYESNLYFKVDKHTILEVLQLPEVDYIEKRDLFTIYHALYTYYTSFICLDACLEKDAFNAIQKHEAMGRIAFYINKCCRDLLIIDNKIESNENAKIYFTEDGLEIYMQLKSKWIEMYKKWNSSVKHFDMDNQPYNFTYFSFLERNPIVT